VSGPAGKRAPTRAVAQISVSGARRAR
jgi:hypothetical protein